MINEKYIDLVTGYLQQSLNDEERRQFDRLIEAGELDRTEVSEMESLYRQMGTVKVPEPGPSVSRKFHAFLKSEQQKQQTSRFHSRSARPAQLLRWLRLTVASVRENMRKTGKPLFEIRRYAYVFVIFLAGLFFGIYLTERNQQDEKIDRLTAELFELREMVMATLLDNPSAAERLRAVNISMDIPPEDHRVAEALLRTLNNDPNINVRLAAADALVRYASDPVVRIGLVESISRQESPIVQAAMADAMLELQEPGAIEQFEKLLADNGLNTYVRYKLENTILELKQS